MPEIRQSVDEFEADIKAFAKELSKKAIKSKLDGLGRKPDF
ncbi:hypothetical protein O9929_15200 [Vibrio lentus]|nr:hypothetical protein [Vibrio lentus]